MALSDAAVRQAKATGKDYTLGDIDGLSLAVTASGGRSWHFRYCWAGKQKRMSLGTYPEVGLRDEARALLAKGINPRVHRKHTRHVVRQADQNTFKCMFDRWVAHRALTLKDGRQSTLAQIRRIFNKDVLPTLGKRSLFEIRRPDLLEVLARIEQRRAFTTAEKCRTWFNQLFRFALVKASGLEQNPASDLDVVAAPKPPVAHHPLLRINELPALLRTLRGYGGMPQTQLGIPLLLLTGVRTGELRWATPDQFDLEQVIGRQQRRLPRQWAGYHFRHPLCRHLRFTRQAHPIAGGEQGQHHLLAGHMLGHLRRRIDGAQQRADLLMQAGLALGMKQHQWKVQGLREGNMLVNQQWMARWQRNRQRRLPNNLRADPVIHQGRASKTRIEQIQVQTADLFRQRHFK